MQGYRTKDFWAGAVYVALGLTAFLLGKGYSLGSAARMGPGYFPMVLSGLLVLIGLISIARGFLSGGEAVPRIHIRPAVLVIGATFFFAATIELLGAAIALPAALIMAAMASRLFRISPFAMLGAAAFTIFCLAVFVKGLGVPMPMFGALFGG
ncbi:tripartite tricarboxylate transporter TctB family protein [Paracoccus ravus]|uniref:tripartite tricarboxylate transporter TctB family protein n=1 Tax=Paracoccus ravus TaxID=2447760 RepID=UPI00106E072B|nr:tripartite tricarboxylate transporter TctB family protein [Paracoccus ravus]